MKKLLLLFAALLLAASASLAQTWGTLNVDLVMSMNTSTPGTALTTAIANAGTVSNNCVPGGAGSTGCSYSSIATGLTVGANQNACSNLGPVAINSGGPTFATQTLNYNNVAHPDTTFNAISLFSFNSGIRPVNFTIAGCFSLGMPGQLNGNDYDMVWPQDNSGHGSIIQIGNGCGGASGQFGVRIEANTPFSHSACIRLFPQSTYWFSLNSNGNTSISTLTVRTPSGTLVGQVTVTSTVGAITQVRMSSNENGTDSGTTFYQNVMMDWTGTPPVEIFWPNNALTAGVLAPSRVIDWTAVGVTGGIPSSTYTQCVTTACQTVTTNGASSNSAQINSALSSAPANSFVSLPSGTYTLNGAISHGTANVALRGTGANSTILNFTGGSPNITVGGGGATNSGSPIAVTPVSGQSGALVQGATSVILASTSGLVVGNSMIIDQNDSTTDNGGILVLGSDSSYTGPFTAPGNAGPYSLQGNGGQNRRCPNVSGSSIDTPTSCFNQEQIVVITSCNGVTTIGTACTGTNVTVGFTPPIHMPNWSTANTLSAWWANSPIGYAGVEDLTVNSSGTSGANGINFRWCNNCWVKGVTVSQTSLAHVQSDYSTNDSVINNYFFLTQNAVTSSYGVVCNSCSHMLIENNIFHAVASPIIWNGSSDANVSAFNFMANNLYTASIGYGQNYIGEHSAGADMNLYEGNVGSWAAADNIHGTGNLSTFFRNTFFGYEPECYASGFPPYSSVVYEQCNNKGNDFELLSYHRFYNSVGNVLNTLNVTSTYNCIETAPSAGCIYILGFGNGVPVDGNVQATLVAWGNADSATGFGSPRFNCNELMQGTAYVSLPASQAFGYNPCPGSNTLPASFHYSAKPSWWPSAKAWPIIGPDVTGGNLLLCTGGAQTRSLVTNSSQCPSGTTSTYSSGEAYSNPAMDCYLSLGGAPNGTSGQLTSFNEASCYSPSGSVVLSPSSLNFGAVPIGSSSSPATFTLTNNSSSTATSITPATVGGSSGDFSITNLGTGSCNAAGGSLSVGSSCTFTVTFIPTAAGPRSTTLSVSYSGGDGNSPQTAALSGVGGSIAPIPIFAFGSILLQGSMLVNVY